MARVRVVAAWFWQWRFQEASRSLRGLVSRREVLVESHAVNRKMKAGN